MGEKEEKEKEKEVTQRGGTSKEKFYPLHKKVLVEPTNQNTRGSQGKTKKHTFSHAIPAIGNVLNSYLGTQHYAPTSQERGYPHRLYRLGLHRRHVSHQLQVFDQFRPRQGPSHG